MKRSTMSGRSPAQVDVGDEEGGHREDRATPGGSAPEFSKWVRTPEWTPERLSLDHRGALDDDVLYRHVTMARTGAGT